MRADRPSSTAALIAAATVFLARDRTLADLVPPGAAEICARCLEAISPLRLAAVRALSRPRWRWLAHCAERSTIPGLVLHFALRKRWIEEAVRRSLEQGCRQVVVIGAGYDTLALRLAPRFPDVRFIEIDHPATQRAKRLAAGATLVRFIGADLARTALQVALSSSDYDANEPSLFVIEGLLMYLTPAEVDRLFAALGELQRAGGGVIFSLMEPAPDGRLSFHNATVLVNRLLALWREPFKSALSRAELAAYLARFGLALEEFAGADELRERYLAPPREKLALARGELTVLAHRR